ncbi:cobalt ABC transporter permease, partial [Staphylococcus gallinarum]
MFDQWKKKQSFVDDVNIITKLLLGVLLFFFVILIHEFDYMVYF